MANALSMLVDENQGLKHGSLGERKLSFENSVSELCMAFAPNALKQHAIRLPHIVYASR
jgi:hypothetical protein